MSDASRQLYLRVVLVAVGLIAIFAVYPLFVLWPYGLDLNDPSGTEFAENDFGFVFLDLSYDLRQFL